MTPDPRDAVALTTVSGELMRDGVDVAPAIAKALDAELEALEPGRAGALDYVVLAVPRGRAQHYADRIGKALDLHGARP